MEFNNCMINFCIGIKNLLFSNLVNFLVKTIFYQLYKVNKELYWKEIEAANVTKDS